jgi:ATP-dependent exoDNAse (exonuclease V) beta subunit
MMAMISQQKLYPVLSSLNADKRDRHIHFEEEGHKYTITTDLHSKYTSVTTWNHMHFPKFDADSVISSMMRGKSWKEGHKYWGLTPEQIKSQWSANGANVSSSGTDLHYQIECFMNNPNIASHYTHKELLEDYMSYILEEELKQTPIEWQYFIQFVKDTPHLKPYRTEWLIYHEDLKLSGSIDMVYENPDNTLSIYDWKRAKEITRVNNFNRFAITQCICHMPDSNFWHYALQLNTYKAILQQKYGKIVTDLRLVRLHPEAKEKNYELIHLPDLTREIGDLFQERQDNVYK